MRSPIYSVLLIAGCASAPAPVPSTNPGGDEDPAAIQVGFLVVDGVYNSEWIAPWDIFQHTRFHTPEKAGHPGMRVWSVAPSQGPVTTFEGLRILPDFTFDDHPPLDVLVVPSALHSMDSDLEDARLLAWVREQGARADWIVSLCDGAFVLAEAGLLDGLASTTFPGDLAAYRERFPELVTHADVSFVHDGKAITSAGGARSYDAALYLCELLWGAEVARGLAGGLVIDWNLEAVPHVTDGLVVGGTLAH